MKHFIAFLGFFGLLQSTFYAEGIALGRDNFSAVRAVKAAIPIGTALDVALNHLASLGFTCRRSNQPDPHSGMIAYDCIAQFGATRQQRRFIVLVTDGNTVRAFQAVLEKPLPVEPPSHDDIRNA